MWVPVGAVELSAWGLTPGFLSKARLLPSRLTVAFLPPVAQLSSLLGPRALWLVLCLVMLIAGQQVLWSFCFVSLVPGPKSTDLMEVGPAQSFLCDRTVGEACIRCGWGQDGNAGESGR